LPEREGWVDRERLYGFRGRGRRELITLAKQFGLRDIPTPSTGCALTETLFAKKVHDLIQFAPEAKRWDFELLKVGRHFRWNQDTKVIVGRNQTENDQLEYLYHLPEAAGTVMMRPENFMGPRVLVVGRTTAESLAFAVGLILRYSKHYDPQQALIRRDSAAGWEIVTAVPEARALAAVSLATESVATS
jgi:hypothetical protein